jgi:antibiotic biosynthesis monooxygenase (ABM) superfamily enzyme
MNHTTTNKLKLRIITTLAGWAAAFIIVYPLLMIFGEPLAALPPAAEACIFTGLLVIIMGNFIMPVINAKTEKFLARTINKHR